MAGRSDFEQSFHLVFLVVGIEVEVQARTPTTSQTLPIKRQVQRDVGASSFRVVQNDKAASHRFFVNIVKRLLSECQHLVKVSAFDNDGTDFHFPSSILSQSTFDKNLMMGAGAIQEMGQNKRKKGLVVVVVVAVVRAVSC